MGQNRGRDSQTQKGFLLLYHQLALGEKTKGQVRGGGVSMLNWEGQQPVKRRIRAEQ